MLYDEEEPAAGEHATAEQIAPVLGALDEIHREDPNQVEWRGEAMPHELAHARAVTYWLGELAAEQGRQPSASALIGASAAHLRRWDPPRSSYPEGRVGYLQWRRDARIRHGSLLAAVCASFEVPQWLADDARALVAKDNLGQKGEAGEAAQLHEDALCLAFFELDAADLIASLPAKTLERVLARTRAKMSERAWQFGVERGLISG